MSSTFIPQDQEARDRIRNSLDENLFVEAGAGTGKTTSLVERVLGLITTGRATLDSIAAITFTEAAAAELRDRIRESLERGAGDPERGDEERGRCRCGVEDLDQASVQTLHGFAANLLQERPLEAGLPPSFEIMDSIAGDLAFDEVWTRWLDTALDDPGLAPGLALALSLGLSPGHLREVAQQFHQDYDQLMGVAFSDLPGEEPRAVRELTAAVPQLDRLCACARSGDADPLYRHVQGLLGPIRRLAEVAPGSVEAYRLLQRMLPVKTNQGRIGDWDQEPGSGENACRKLKSRLTDLDQQANQELSRVRRRVMMPLLRTLRAMVLEYAADRKRQGRAEFHDLLVWTRDLLRDNIEVRDHFRQRFSHLLVDEAQDTDPIQAEIAMFLAEDTSKSPPGPGRPRTWEEVRPVPGKLFVVGDPKQSIYRFRRADVAQMGRLRERLDGDTVRLVQNFRSHQPVLAWVNHVFQRWMTRGDQQTEYVSVSHRWEVTTDHAFGPRVWRLGQALEERHIGRVRQKEAREIAALLRSIVQDEWQVLDPTATREAGRERYRNATYADVCILMPRRTALRSLELALDHAGLPYRLEGASLIFGTQEVRDLINCLRAIDDPADQVALVAALRSPAFACSDVDLLRFVQSGGKLDYLEAAGDQTGPVAEGFLVLNSFHQDRLWTSIPALIDRFLRERLLLEAALDHPRTREQWRRYRFMVEQARAFAAVGGNSLRSFLDWVERQAAEGARVTEVPVPEGDESAVRIMTVHAAKGLEFPVVVLTGLNSGNSPRVDGVLIDRRGGAVEVKTGTAAQSFSTPGYEDLANGEKERDLEESVRLLYVAATRARDHLVLSMYRKSNDGDSAASTIAGFLDGEDHLWEPVGELHALPAAVAEAAPPPGELAGHTPEHRDEWRKGRKSTLHRQRKPVAVAATTLARIAKEEVRSEEPWKKGRGGTSLGRAVHAVLQTADLATGQGLEATARAQATAEGIFHREGEVLALARAALASPVVKRAVAARRLWREVPVAAPLDGHIIEGIIDLLFEEADGLVVVDYKTDALDAGETGDAVDRYRIQGGVYALALEKATGQPVKEVVFLFLRPRKEETIIGVAQIKDLAEARVAAYWASSGQPC